MAGGNNARIYIRKTSQNTPEVNDFARRWVNLADARLGARVVEVSDEFYAPAQRMLNPQPANYYFHDEEGMRWVDGWETSRRRQAGHEHCVIRLGRRGRVAGLVFDTSFYTGNYPVGVEVEGCRSDDETPGAGAAWTPLVGFTPLAGDTQRLVVIDDPGLHNHVRLHLHPDGGMARVRVLGAVDPSPLAGAPGLVDLAALENGGRIVGCNDRHFGSVDAMIAPGPSVEWGKGWETRRRREPGHDWAVIALARPGRIEEVEVDTKYYLANQPHRFSLQAVKVEDTPADEVLLNQSMFWPELLGEVELKGGACLQLRDGLRAPGAVSHVRLNIFPDGGVTRLRLRGRPQ
ncbi:MAG: allantoicase [Rubrivivax sp.]